MQKQKKTAKEFWQDKPYDSLIGMLVEVTLPVETFIKSVPKDYYPLVVHMVAKQALKSDLRTREYHSDEELKSDMPNWFFPPEAKLYMTAYPCPVLPDLSDMEKKILETYNSLEGTVRSKAISMAFEAGYAYAKSQAEIKT